MQFRTHFWRHWDPILDNFRSFLVLFLLLFSSIDFASISHWFLVQFVTPEWRKITFLLQTCSKNQGFAGSENTTFSFDFYPDFKTFLNYFFASYLFLFPLHLFNEILIVFSSFLTPRYTKNGPQNGTKKCQKKWRGLPKPSKVYPDLQKYDFGTHLVSFCTISEPIWCHFGIILTWVLTAFRAYSASFFKKIRKFHKP